MDQTHTRPIHYGSRLKPLQTPKPSKVLLTPQQLEELHYTDNEIDVLSVGLGINVLDSVEWLLNHANERLDQPKNTAGSSALSSTHAFDHRVQDNEIEPSVAKARSTDSIGIRAKTRHTIALRRRPSFF